MRTAPPRPDTPAGRPVPAANAGPAAPPAAPTPRPSHPARPRTTRPRAHPHATMPPRARHTPIMKTSETSMIIWRARTQPLQTRPSDPSLTHQAYPTTPEHAGALRFGPGRFRLGPTG